MSDQTLVLATAALLALSLASCSSPRPAGDERSKWESNPLVQRAIEDAARTTGVEPGSVRVLSVEARDWPDASLGCPKPGMMYAQVITPGFLIALEAGGRRLEYHADSDRRLEQC
jgi:hypothetical protein